MSSAIIRIFLTALTLLLCQMTRFENRISIGQNSGKLYVSIDQQQFEFEAVPLDFQSKLALIFQKSVNSESGISSISIIDTDQNKQIFEQHKTLLYLFGRDLLGNMINSSYSTINNSLGDWSLDRYNSELKDISIPELPVNFRIEIAYVGRGDKFLSLTGKTKLQLHLRDGFIDNDYAIAFNENTLASGTLDESIPINLTRICNFFLEPLFVALALSVLLAIFSNKALQSVQKDAGCFPSLLCWLSVIFVFGSSCWFSIFILGGIPHIPDSAEYFRQAIMLSKGLLSVPYPDFAAREIILPSGVIDLGATFSFHYNRIWPAILSVGVLTGTAPFLNPLFAALSVLLVYRLAVRFFDKKVAALTAVLAAASPFLVIMAGDYMTHSCTGFLILLFLELLFLSAQKKSGSLAFIAGLILALSYTIRGGTTLFLSMALALFLLLTPKYRPTIKQIGFILAGSLIPLTVYMLDNYSLTGSALTSPYVKYHSLSLNFSNLNFGLNYADATLGFLTPMLSGNPFRILIWGLVFLPLVWKCKREDLFLFMTLLALVSLQAFFNSYGIHGYGPRFYYESLFFLFILAARGLNYFIQEFKRFAPVMLSAIFIFTVYSNFQSYYGYRNYNGIDTALFAEIKKADLKKIILLTTDPYWSGLDIAATLWDPFYKDLIFIKITQGSNAHLEVLKKFPERQAFITNPPFLTKFRYDQ